MSLLQETRRIIDQQRAVEEAKKSDLIKNEKGRETEAEAKAKVRIETIRNLCKTWEELGCTQILEELQAVVWPVSIAGPFLKPGFDETIGKVDILNFVAQEQRIFDGLRETLKQYDPEYRLSSELREVYRYRDDTGWDASVTIYFELFLTTKEVGFQIYEGKGRPEIRIPLAGSDPKTALIKSIDTSVADYLKTRK